MRNSSAVRVLLALSVGLGVAACDTSLLNKPKLVASAPPGQIGQPGGDASSQAYLEATTGTEQEKAGRAIVKDTIALLQADLDAQVGSTLADDPGFGGAAAKYSVQGESAPSVTATEPPPTLDQMKANLTKVDQMIADLEKVRDRTADQDKLLAHLRDERAALAARIEAAEKAAAGSNTGTTTTATARPTEPPRSATPTPKPDGASTAATPTPPPPTLDQLRAWLADMKAKIAELEAVPDRSAEQAEKLAHYRQERDHLAAKIAEKERASAATPRPTEPPRATPAPGTEDIVQKMEAIKREAQPLIDKINRGEKLSEAEAKNLDNLKKAHADLEAKLKATLHSSGDKPPEGGTVKRPETPRPDLSKVEAPDHRPPEEVHRTPPPAKTGSGDSEDARKYRETIEKLQRANEELRKQLAETNAKLKELSEKLAKVADEHKKRVKDNKVERSEPVQNEDGSLTYSTKWTSVASGSTTTHEVTKTVNELGEVVEETSYMKKVHSNGTTVTVSRTKTRIEGGWRMEFNSEIVKDGKTKTVDWVRVEKDDHTGSAKGRIKRPDGSVVEIEITRDDNGTTHTVATDSGKKVKAEITKHEAETKADAKITDTDGKEIARVRIDDTEAVAPGID